MIWGPLPAVGIANSVTTPLVVMRPILLAPFSVNHRLPSGPAVMPAGLLVSVGVGNSVIAPAAVIRATRLTPFETAPVSVIHRLATCPAGLSRGELSGGGCWD